MVNSNLCTDADEESKLLHLMLWWKNRDGIGGFSFA